MVPNMKITTASPTIPKSPTTEASHSGSLGGEARGIGARWSCLKPQDFSVENFGWEGVVKTVFFCKDSMGFCGTYIHYYDYILLLSLLLLYLLYLITYIYIYKYYQLPIVHWWFGALWFWICGISCWKGLGFLQLALEPFLHFSVNGRFF